MENKEVEIQQEQEKVRQLTKSLEEIRADIDAKEKEALLKEQQCEEQAVKLKEEMEKSVSEKEAQLKMANAEIDKSREVIQQMEETAKYDEKECNNLKIQLEEQQRFVQKADIDRKQNENDLAKWKSIVSAKEDECAILKNMVDIKEMERMEKESEIGKQEQIMERHHNMFKDRDEQRIKKSEKQAQMSQ